SSNPLMIRYHDEEWGVPLHDERRLFEFLVLEGAQAGLSWSTILNKRVSYRRAMDRFDPKRVARYDGTDLKRLLSDASLVRNRLKWTGAIDNARAFLAVQQECGSFDRFIWTFPGGRTITNRRRHLRDLPASTAESEAMSRELKRRGFRFVGPTI